MNTGQLNDAILPEAEKHRAALILGRKLCRRFGLDPDRYSSAYLVGCAMDVATLVGEVYAFGSTESIPTTDTEHAAIRLFQETHDQETHHG